MSSKQAVWAVVPAAGIGSRMQAEIPKQYLLIDDKPVLQLTLERLASHPAIEGIVIALAENDFNLPADVKEIKLYKGETGLFLIQIKLNNKTNLLSHFHAVFYSNRKLLIIGYHTN